MQTVVTVPTVPSPQRPFFQNKFSPGGFQKTPGFFQNNQQFNRQQANAAQAIEFDGKRLRKAVARKTVDYNASIVKYLETRTWQRDYRDRRALQPDVGYSSELMPPMSYLENPVNAITTKFVRTSTNKMRCPIFCVVWTPEGRRLITGASSGEFTLWNGLTFNFETILQAHDSPVRCMVWSHNDIWMVTGDHSGYVKYWQSNMNNVKMFQAHKEPLRGLSFCPTDTKFVTCSDDGTVRIWDFLRCHEEKILRGHGADVKCVSWHPQKALIVSGSKDSQQPIKLWDPKSGQSLATLHAHKSTVMEVKWNQNGTWMLTASRDHLLKLFDIRNMSQEVQTFRGHKKEACSISWHPIHESMFVSGGSDGSVMFWVVGADKEVGSMDQAHESCVWSLGWHPLGHILCTGSNDHTSKFWTRNRPGDRMRDKYNLNTLPRGQDETAEYDEPSTGGAIPGMGLDIFGDGENGDDVDFAPSIPGLDFGSDDAVKNGNAIVHLNTTTAHQNRKVPFSKPIPRQFQQQWMENKQPLLLAPPSNSGNDANQSQNQGGNQPMLQAPSMGALLPSGPGQLPPVPSQMGSMLPPTVPMAPGMSVPMLSNIQGPMLPNMQSNPDNQMMMGDMVNRGGVLQSHSMGDFQGNNQLNSNFPMNPMLQQNVQMQGGGQFGPVPNMFMQGRPPLDLQPNNEMFGPRGGGPMLQRPPLLGSRPNQMPGDSENISQNERNSGNMPATNPSLGENRNNTGQMVAKQTDDRDWKKFPDFDDRSLSGKETDFRNTSKDMAPTSSASNIQSSHIPPPPFNFVPHQNQPFHPPPPPPPHQNMLQNEPQRFGGRDDLEDRLNNQPNFNRNMNMPGRGGLSNPIHSQNTQNFHQSQNNQFGANSFQDNNDSRFMGPRMGGPDNSRMGLFDNSRMGGPDNSRMGGPDNSRMGGPDNSRMGGPDNNSRMGSGPDFNRMGGPPGMNHMGGPDMSRMGPPDMPRMGGPPDMSRMGGQGMGGPDNMHGSGNDYDSHSDNMRKRQWDDGPGNMGGQMSNMPQGGPHWNQQQGFPNRGGGGLRGEPQRGFMRGGRGMGNQRGQGNRPFRGNFRGNRGGNMRNNSNF